MEIIDFVVVVGGGGGICTSDYAMPSTVRWAHLLERSKDNYAHYNVGCRIQKEPYRFIVFGVRPLWRNRNS